MNTLNTKAWRALLVLAAVMALLLFVPAGAVHYWQAWAYLGVYFGAVCLVTLYLMKKDPVLLAHRLSGGPMAEQEKAQKVIMLVASLGFIAAPVVSALDHRFRWSDVPPGAVIAGDILTALGFFLVFLVFRENTFASATIEVSGDQRVISTGLYAFVRHPMYVGGILIFIGMPPALGSYWGLLALLVTLPAVIWRLLDEERFLNQNLPGYAAYCAKVRWRLLPGVF